MSRENIIIVETTPGEPLGAAFVCGPRGHGALVKRFHNTGKTNTSTKKGQLERHGVRKKMLLISINGHNVTKLMFEEIILLLRACRTQSKMLVFNMKMGQDAVIRKTLVGFQPKNKSKKKKVRAAQSFRQALQRRKNDPLWI